MIASIQITVQDPLSSIKWYNEQMLKTQTALTMIPESVFLYYYIKQ